MASWTVGELLDELEGLDDPSRVINVQVPMLEGGTMLLDQFVIDEDENYVFLRCEMMGDDA